MWKRFLVAMAIVAVAAPPAVALAHVDDERTTVATGRNPSVVRAGARVVVFGRIRSAEARCVARKVVRIYRALPGRDRLVGGDVTSASGVYTVSLRPRFDMRVYARFAGSFAASYGHQHRCRGDNSRPLLIDVRR